MGKELESRQEQMRRRQIGLSNRTKKKPSVKGKHTYPNRAEDGRKVDQFQPQTEREKEAVAVVKLLENRIQAGKKLPMEAVQKLREFTRCPELTDLLNDLLPPLRETFESRLFWSKGISMLVNSERLQELRCYEYFIERLELHQVKTERKPSLDYYDWNTEDHYDWVDHYEQFGPREEIAHRRGNSRLSALLDQSTALAIAELRKAQKEV